MNKTVRIILIILAVVFIPVYLFYAIGFTLQLIGLSDSVSREGFRGALTSSGSSDMEFYASVTWLIIMAISIYVIPLLLVMAEVIYLIKRRKMKRL